MIKTLGLANRARKILLGTELVINALPKKQIHLVLLSNEAASNTSKLVINKCNYYEVDYLIVDDYQMNQAVGKTNIKVIGIADQGFSQLLLKKN